MSGEGQGQIGSGDIVTAALLVIGDEILSGRTKDKNIGHIADHLTAIGIQMKEVRIVADEEDEIVDALNALRKRYNYVFTTGGIGPTHDDITADAVAKGRRRIDVDERGWRRCGYYRGVGRDLTPARLRWRAAPSASSCSRTPLSIAPSSGWATSRMAGVPNIMHVMLESATRYSIPQEECSRPPWTARPRRDRRDVVALQKPTRSAHVSYRSSARQAGTSWCPLHRCRPSPRPRPSSRSARCPRLAVVVIRGFST